MVLSKVVNGKIEIEDIDEILQREVKPFGRDTAHISGVSKDHIGKKVQVIIWKNKEGLES